MEKPIHPEVVALQARLFQHRFKIGQILNRCGVSPSTWWRWTQGAEPKMSTLAKMTAAVDAKLGEKERAA